MKEEYKMYHHDTYEVLTREIYNARYCHPLDAYLDRFWHSLDHYRPDIEALIASLERDIQVRTEDMEKYPTDWSYIIQCRQYIPRHREWITRCAELSIHCEKSEAHNNAIFKRLEASFKVSREREQERIARSQMKGPDR